MKAIEIDLTAPLVRVLDATHSLPVNGSEAEDSENEVREATRCLYEAAHGRVVDTSIGPIAIAPALASALKDVPIAVTSRAEFLDFAEANSGFRRTARPPLNGLKAEPMKASQPRPPKPNQSSSAHSSRDSALHEFMSGRLGAPDCWPDEDHPAQDPWSREPRGNVTGSSAGQTRCRHLLADR